MENNEIKPKSGQADPKKFVGVEKMKEMLKSKNYILGMIILVLIVGYSVYAKNPDAVKNLFSKNISEEQAKTKLKGFIEKNLVAPGTEVEIKDVIGENGLYKVTVDVSGQEIISYLSKDGKVFFPQGAMNIEEVEKQAAGEGQQAAAAKEVPKSDVPEVKLFVMSYCPYGTQIEKGILPVVQTLGAKIKYSLEFVDYAMHGDKEIAENMRQYCIQKTQPAKLSNYLTCFLKKGEGTEAACMQTAGVNTAQVTSCVAQTDAQFKVTADAADKSKWDNAQFPPFNVNRADNEKYGVQGSPTLVINDTEAQTAGRDSASLLKTICAAFNTPPKECSAQLPATAPAAGFGEGTSASSGADVSCAS